MESQKALIYNWDYVEELFQPGVIEAMFEAFTGLLTWLSAPNNDWSSPLPPLIPTSQAAVRRKVNATQSPYFDGLLHEKFFEQASRWPDRLALAHDKSGILSYGELARRVRRIAALLIARGLEPGEPVGVTLPRGFGQVEAILGILSAGGAYVPVGITQPVHRRDSILRSAEIRFVITDKFRVRVGDWPANIELISLDSIVDVDETDEILPVVNPNTMAYIIYTSGSTGEPKGVMMSHRAAWNTIIDINRRFSVDENDRVLAVSALDFDLSVYDIFGMLSVGGAVVLIDEEDQREARRWAEQIMRWKVTVWNSVPVLLDMLLAVDTHAEMLQTLRLALLSGDWIGLDLPGRLSIRAPQCRFIAMGGATEAAIWSNVYEVSRVPEHWRSIPYGYPLSNQRFRVVDIRGRDCPDWVPGELWIGGAGVALGYRGNPTETALHFLEVNGERWYRTGDFGRYWPDGTLEFLGRADQQIKIRGHRIELGEIESVLKRYPAVLDAIIVTTSGLGQKLIAFIVVGEESVDEISLRSFLAQHLPAYMLPERIACIERLPLNPNGKVDRPALIRLAAETALSAKREAPVGPVEMHVAKLWSELLQREDIGRDDNFFALGGNSLLATRLVEAVRKHLHTELTMRQLVNSPTVSGLAAMIMEQRNELDAGTTEEGTI
jgi:amino acid adenylation domain-containing protein